MGLHGNIQMIEAGGEAFWFWSVVVFIFGSCIGSFLNVCIWRIPRDESLISPSSHCPKCGHSLSWFENIPLFSWLCLGGRCGKCRESISFRYFFVELFTALLFLLVWFKVVSLLQPLTILSVYFVMTMLVVTTIFIDAEHFIIPNETTYPALAAGLIFSLAFPEIWNTHSRISALMCSSAGLVFGAGIFAVFAIAGKMIFKREALGWGDVKYLGAAGACLGASACFFIVLFASLMGAVAGLLLIACGKGKLKSAIPFGPYLAVATYFWIVCGNKIVFWYISMLNSFAVR